MTPVFVVTIGDVIGLVALIVVLLSLGFVYFLDKKNPKN